MKKNMSYIKYALLSFSSIFLGCNILQINDNVKVIKNDSETIIDIGNKNGAYTKINLNVKSDLFNTKAFIPGYSGQILPLNNTTLILKLNRFNTGTNPPSPYDRFNDVSVVASIPLSNINTTTPITLKGLNLGKDYYISGKLYRNELLIDTNILTLNTSTSTSVTSTGGTFTSLKIVPGDIIRIGADTTEYEVITVAPNTLTLNTATPSTLSVQQLKLKRNIVAIGDIGRNASGSKGTSILNTALGGGTIPAKTSGICPGLGCLEEYIQVNNNGSVLIQNDVGITNSLDIDIQLMKDIPAAFFGNNGKGIINVLTSGPKPIELDSFFVPRETDRLASNPNIIANDQAISTLGSIQADINGNLFMAYSTSNSVIPANPNQRNIIFNRYDKTNNVFSETTVNSNTLGNKRRFSLKSNGILSPVNGQIIIVWEDDWINSSTTERTKLFYQRYSPNGTLMGANIGIPTVNVDRNQTYPSVGLGRNIASNFLVSWSEERGVAVAPGGIGNDYTPAIAINDVYGKLFDSTGTQVSTSGCFTQNPFKVNSGTYTGSENALGSHVSFDDTGNFIVSWAYINGANPVQTRFKIFDSSGCPKSSEIQLVGDTGTPKNLGARYAFDSLGNFVAVWLSGTVNPYNLYAQKFSPTGQKIGDALLIKSVDQSPLSVKNPAEQPSTAAGTDTFLDPNEPAIAMSKNGDFVVAFRDKKTINEQDIFYVPISKDMIMTDSIKKVNTNILPTTSPINNFNPNISLSEDRAGGTVGDLYISYVLDRDPSLTPPATNGTKVFFKRFTKPRTPNN